MSDPTALPDDRARGALCYPVGALFGPVPMVVVLRFASSAFTRRCATQALLGFSALLASGALALFVIVGGLLAQGLVYGAASLADGPEAPPLVRAAGLVAGLLVWGTYAAQLGAALVFARRALRGEVTRFPLGGAALDRAALAQCTASAARERATNSPSGASAGA